MTSAARRPNCAGRLTLGLLLVSALAALPGLAACGGDDTSVTPETPDAGAADTSTPVATVEDKATLLDYDTKKPVVPKVTVTEGGQTTTTAADGTWSLRVPSGQPITLVMSEPSYTKLTWPEVILSGDTDRGKITLVSLSTFHIAGGALPTYDPTLGVLYLSVYKTGACADATGASLTVTEPAGTSIAYFGRYGLPDGTATATVAGPDPALAVYNIKPGAKVVLAFTHPTCKQAAFPHTEGTVTYTGNITTEGGDSNAYARVYLE